MKKIIDIILKIFIFYLILLFSFSCKAQTNSYHYINTLRSIDIPFTKINDSVLVFDNSSDKSIMVNYINTIFSSNIISSIDSAKLDILESTKYLKFTGLNDTASYVLVAQQITLSMQSNYIRMSPESGGESHSCSGVKCGCCDFMKKKGKIIGCYCNPFASPYCHHEVDSYCNHSVSTTQ